MSEENSCPVNEVCGGSRQGMLLDIFIMMAHMSYVYQMSFSFSEILKIYFNPLGTSLKKVWTWNLTTTKKTQFVCPHFNVSLWAHCYKQSHPSEVKNDCLEAVLL